MRAPVLLVLLGHLLSLPARAEGTAMFWCDWVTTRLAPQYRAFVDRQANRERLLDRSSVRGVLALEGSSCATPDDERRAQALFRRVVDAHSGRIGALLPLTGGEGEMGRALQAGLRAAVPADRLVFFDTQGSARTAEEGLAELLFRHNVAMVVVGGGTASVTPVVHWASQLILPVLVMAGESVDIGRSKFVYRVYPRAQDMGDALAEAARSHDWGRVALLRPDDGHADRILRHFSAAAEQRGLVVGSPIDYQAGNFDSMDKAIRTLFEIDPQARAAEYKKMVQAAKLKAEAAGVAYDPRTVILKPHVTSDVTFIADDFRIVRHFAKLMRFHGVRRMPLLGDPAWRSPGLVEPPEPFLDGALFVDFIGSYRSLPPGLDVPTVGRGDFAAPQATAIADYGLIGWRAGRIAAEAARVALYRRDIPGMMTGLTDFDAAQFGAGPAFDERRESRWPVYLFGVEKGKVTVQTTPVRAELRAAAASAPVQ